MLSMSEYEAWNIASSIPQAAHTSSVQISHSVDRLITRQHEPDHISPQATNQQLIQYQKSVENFVSQEMSIIFMLLTF